MYRASRMDDRHGALLVQMILVLFIRDSLVMLILLEFLVCCFGPPLLRCTMASQRERVAFANFYMCNLENNIFQTQPSLKPTIYCRYIDDIFIVTPNIQQLQLLKNAFEQNSSLKFTTEIGLNNKINFLDVNINNSHEHVVTQPFVKPTNSGIYLNIIANAPL